MNWYVIALAVFGFLCLQAAHSDGFARIRAWSRPAIEGRVIARRHLGRYDADGPQRVYLTLQTDDGKQYEIAQDFFIPTEAIAYLDANPHGRRVRVRVDPENDGSTYEDGYEPQSTTPISVIGFALLGAAVWIGLSH
ncbi:MAG: hypothetical protein ABTQ29_07310 [Siculibacillus sp.]